MTVSPLRRIPGRLAFFLLAGAVMAASVRATVLRPISEDDQIRQAQTIFRGKVERIDVARESVNGFPPVVISTVRFQPLAIYKGAPSSPTALKFLGGTIDGRTMKVDGMPQFSVGQEYILFVSPETNLACPVLGWSEGSLKVNRQHDPAGSVSVAPTSGHATGSISSRSRSIPTDGSLSLPTFEARLRARIESLGINR